MTSDRKPPSEDEATRVIPPKHTAANNQHHDGVTRFQSPKTERIESNTVFQPRANTKGDDGTVVQPPKNRTRTKAPSYSKEPVKGDVIRDRFILHKELGRGGMGAVYQALDKLKKEADDNEPYVAIKLLYGDFKEHPQAFVSLQREAKKTHALAHPNIVTCYDFDRDGGLVFLTMEMLEGHALSNVIRGKTEIHIDKRQALDIIEQIASGLAYAHKKGIVHADLKPANIFLCKDGTVKILDFGIARVANDSQFQDTYDAGDLGAMTYTYSSPEMIRFENAHTADDIYALGLIVCELLGGPHPFDRIDALKAQEQGLKPNLPAISNPLLKKTVLSALAFDRKRRISDGETFLQRFRFAKKAPLRLALTSILLFLLIIGNAVYLHFFSNASIPFNDLPEEQQIAFHSFIEEGKTALKFQDLQGAVVNFNNAYLIHTDNKSIKDAKRAIKAIYQKRRDEESNSEFLQTELEELKNYPMFSDLGEGW